MPPETQLTINASPTKNFFISMLTRDIPLTRAIIDLVDNSVDGARRVRPPIAQGPRFDGLSVRLECSPRQFKISDNCGGMKVEHAREYAFRFGRPEGVEATPNSVGQFGVGMKRALFKMGKKFEVSSRSATTRFVVKIDVDEWRAKKDAEGREIWEFEFSELEEDLVPTTETYTTVTVTELNDEVSKEFENQSFVKQLKFELEAAQKSVLDVGMAITLNQIPLNHDPLQLLSSDFVKPAATTFVYFGDTQHPVHVQLFAGISKEESTEMGWYVFCNGRSVLEADTSTRTGWGEGTPKAHYQFKLFRGFAYFDCDDASKLPWNTTKTGIDTDSLLFKTVRQQMIATMRPVIDFLNDVERERKDPDQPQVLVHMISEAKPIRLTELPKSDTFVTSRPNDNQQMKRATRTISYVKPSEKVERVMEALGVRTPKAAGEATFDYYIESELD